MRPCEACRKILGAFRLTKREPGDGLDHGKGVLHPVVELIDEELPCFLLRFPLCDVMGDRGIPGEPAIAVAERGKAEDDLDQGPILPEPAHIARQRLAALLDLLCMRFECRALHPQDREREPAGL